MKQATHFIEVRRYRDGEVSNGIVSHTKDMNNLLMVSSFLLCETIAIFKIYPKQQAHAT